MIAEKKQNGFYIFEKSSGMTCVFSGRELDYLLDYARTGKRTAFIDRLFDLRILVIDSPAARMKILSAASLPLSDGDNSRLHAIHIALTNRCPHSCPQCYQGKSGTLDMPLIYLQDLVDEAERIGVFQIALGGGEPLVYPHLLSAVHHIGTTEMSVTLTTSGRGLSLSWLNQLRDAGLNHMQISLNSVDRTINGLSRDGYDDAINALKMLSGSGLSFGINWVARSDNLGGFEKMTSLAADLGANNLNVLRYKPSALEDYQQIALSRAQFTDLARAIMKTKGIRIEVDSAYSPMLCFLYGERVDRIRCGCGAGRTFVAVSVEGHFAPCSHLPLMVPASNLENYLQSEDCQDFIAITNQLDGLCGNCLHRTYCGGCRAICGHLYGHLGEGERNCPSYVAGIGGQQ